MPGSGHAPTNPLACEWTTYDSINAPSRRHHHRRRSVRREAPGRLPRSHPEYGRSEPPPPSISPDSVAARSAPSTALEPTRPKRWPPSSPKSATDTTLYAKRDNQLTLDSLVAWYLEFAREDRGLDHSTLTGYADAYSHWLKEQIGHKQAGSITTAELDTAFDRIRRAGLSRSRMNNARALLSGAFKWGKRHRKVTSNPVDGFELPTSTHTPRHTTAPELDDLLRLLATADEHDEMLAPVLKLAATTGLRRGELSGLRRDRLHLDQHELIVDTAINDAGGIVVEKQTKTRSSRAVTLDEATIELLREHLAEMDARAAACGTSVAPDGYVFSLDPTCSTPLRPELLTRRTRQLRKDHGLTDGSFDATILALRKWTTSALIDADSSRCGERQARPHRAGDRSVLVAVRHHGVVGGAQHATEVIAPQRPTSASGARRLTGRRVD